MIGEMGMTLLTFVDEYGFPIKRKAHRAIKNDFLEM